MLPVMPKRIFFPVNMSKELKEGKRKRGAWMNTFLLQNKLFAVKQRRRKRKVTVPLLFSFSLFIV
jgi:hypothetical protein